MIVDRFEVFRLDAIPRDIRLGVAASGDVAHQILDENGVRIGAFGDRFFVGSFQQAVELAARAAFDEPD